MRSRNLGSVSSRKARSRRWASSSGRWIRITGSLDPLVFGSLSLFYAPDSLTECMYERSHIMPQRKLASWTRADYERAAMDYLARLPPEHFMEATPHSTQREITIESFAVLRALRPGVELCNELLVQ